MSLIIAVLALGFLILIHEFGHFIAAKKLGVRVEAFSIGFGPPIVHKKVGETDYKIAVLPLGGYIKMAGENPDDETTGAPDEFSSQPVWKKIIIIGAGPIMNLLLGVALLYVLFFTGVPLPAYYSAKPMVYKVDVGSAAATAGVKDADRILSVEGKKTSTWESVFNALGKSGEKQIEVRRNGKTIKLKLPLTGNKKLGLVPYTKAVIGELISLYPAAGAGLKRGDEIIKIDDTEIGSWYDMTKYINARPNKEISIEVRRGNRILNKKITVRSVKISGKELGMIGIQPPTIKRRYPAVQSLKNTFYTSINMSLAIYYTLKQLILGRLSANLVSGPVGIVVMAKNQVQQGMSSLIKFIALLTINLGVINLLPIPMVDGGELLTYGAEGIIRRKIKPKYRALMQQAGFAVILFLFAFALYSDIIKFFK